MKKLIAKIPILYLTKQYKPGEEIPANDPDMVEAWLENNAASWVEDNPEKEETPIEEGLEKEEISAEENPIKEETLVKDNTENEIPEHETIKPISGRNKK
jgi:hypothetical protein